MNGNGMKKRWISLYVENQVGVLSKISGLFSGKSYNLDSLTQSYTTIGVCRGPTSDSHSVCVSFFSPLT